jgi:histidinol-phosphatase
MAQSKELAFALDICRQAGETALRHFKNGVRTNTKYDGSPVTVADTECERLIREGLSSHFSRDAILGEEEGATEGQQSADGETVAKRRWIIDPIDGTYGFARGAFGWSTLLALEVEDEIVLGVVHAPASGETFWAEKGEGAWKNGNRLQVSTYDDMAKAQLDFGSLSRIIELGLFPGFEKLVLSTGRQRCAGDYLGFAHVLEGTAEAQLEVGVKPWDLAPFRILVTEAGGKYSDLAGGQSIYTGNCLVTNGVLFERFLSTLVGP